MGDRHGCGIKKDRIHDPLNLVLYSLLRLVAVASVRSLHR